MKDKWRTNEAKWRLSFLLAQSSTGTTATEQVPSTYFIPMYNSQIALVRMDGPKNSIPGETPSVNTTRWCKYGEKHGRAATRKTASNEQRNKQARRKNVRRLSVASTLLISQFSNTYFASAGIKMAVQEDHLKHEVKEDILTAPKNN